MFAKLYHTVAIVATAIVLAGGGLVGVMYGTGKLTAERIEALAAVLRQDPNQPVEATDTVADESVAPSTRAASAEELRQQQQDAQLRRVLDERAANDRIAQRRLLDQALHHLVLAEERLERDKAQWDEELKRRRGAARDAGFSKELSLIADLPPKTAKDHLIRKWKESPADAVRLLNALPKSTSKRILGQMKSPEELQITHELLERLSQDDPAQFEP